MVQIVYRMTSLHKIFINISVFQNFLQKIAIIICAVLRVIWSDLCMTLNLFPSNKYCFFAKNLKDVKISNVTSQVKKLSINTYSFLWKTKFNICIPQTVNAT